MWAGLPKDSTSTMSRWDDYKEENLVNGEHKRFPGWKPVGVWTFQRSDGSITHHKADSPFAFWESTCEWSMEKWDKMFPAPIPEEKQEECYEAISKLGSAPQP